MNNSRSLFRTISVTPPQEPDPQVDDLNFEDIQPSTTPGSYDVNYTPAAHIGDTWYGISPVNIAELHLNPINNIFLAQSDEEEEL